MPASRLHTSGLTWNWSSASPVPLQAALAWAINVGQCPHVLCELLFFQHRNLMCLPLQWAAPLIEYHSMQQAAKATPQRMARTKAWISRLLTLLLAAAEAATEPLSKPQESYISARSF